MKDKIILLVEDNEDDIELTLEALKDNNIKNEVVVARDGEEALDYLFSRGKYSGDGAKILPAVILLDIKLPKIDGLEVLREIRKKQRTKLLPVVMLTSSKEDVDLVKGYNLGCNSYVRKPLNFEEFNKTIKTLGLYWLLMNEVPSVINNGKDNTAN